MRIRKLLLVSLCIASFSIGAFASVLDDAKELYVNEKYDEALSLFMGQYDTNKRNSSVNQMIGVSLVKLNRDREAIPYLEFAASKGLSESTLYLSEVYFKMYDYAKAETYLDKYEALLKKAKKPVPDEAQLYIKRFRKARGMLDHVENIQVIDSLIVDKDDFFRAYKLSPEAGSFSLGKNLKNDNIAQDAVVFIPESNEQMLWAENDESGNSVIMESNKLIDGSWDKPHKLSGDIYDGGNLFFPYMMPDGTTIYFASDGENSIGGKDIFKTRKDLETSSYLQPQNMGMPYNSPFDDYLLAIDEFTGVGWWATDRNQIPGKVTIYLFIPSDMRINHSPDDANIESLAAIKSIKDTWKDGADYQKIKDDIEDNMKKEVVKKSDFYFPVRPNKVYTSLNDFKSSTARSLMKNYLKESKLLEDNLKRLETLRIKYAKEKSQAKYATEIKDLETFILKQRKTVESLANQVRREEK